MSYGGIYNTGTITINTGSNPKAVIGSGTLWSPTIEQGDLLIADGLVAIIDEITDDTHLILSVDWPGSNLSASEYIVVKVSWLRLDTAITQQKVRQLLEGLAQQSIIFNVTGTSPDTGLGEDGQFALKVNEGAWQLWLKDGADWVLQGNPVGFSYEGLYNNSTTYNLNDIVQSSGNAYVSLEGSNVGNAPASSPTKWGLLVVGGSRYDVVIWDNGKPVAGEVVMRMITTTEVEFQIDLAGSQAKCDTAPTSDATWSIKKNGVEFATCTFLASQTTGSFIAASATTFSAGDILTVVAPNPQDATLSSVYMTLTAYR